MRRTQIQLPDWLYDAAQGVADRREMSLAALVRQGLEYMVRLTPEADMSPEEWTLPEPRVLESTDPFGDEDWRVKLHLRIAEDMAATLQHHGVRHFASRNVKDFAQLGFETVWNPLSGEASTSPE